MIIPRYAAKLISGYMDAQVSYGLVSTKCDAIDDILEGGFPTGRIITISGPSETGKTTIAYSVVSSFLSCENARVMWIDTSGMFSVQRLIDIAQHKGDICKPKVLERVGIVRAFDVWGIMDGVNEFRYTVNKSIHNHDSIPGVLVIDNITNPLSLFMQREQIRGHSIMVSLVHSLFSIFSYNRRILVLMINSTVKSHSTNLSAFSSTELKPALGITWPYLSDLDILITKAPVNADYSSAIILEVISDRYGTLLGKWGFFTIINGYLCNYEFDKNLI